METWEMLRIRIKQQNTKLSAVKYLHAVNTVYNILRSLRPW